MEIRLRLTSNCNLNCEYCFAKKFRKDNIGDISDDNLNMLLAQCLREGITKIKIQGGESTSHKNFEKVSLLFKKRKMICHLYTNGAFRPDLINLISKCYKSVIINYNDLDKSLLGAVSNNIDMLIKNECPVMLGKTLSIENYDIDNFLSFASKFKNRIKLRIDICRPNEYSKNNFEEFKQLSKKLINCIIKANIQEFSLELDCCLPSCFFTKSEWQIVKKYLRGFWSKCSTIIDVDPSLKITSCFCGVQFDDLYMDDFDSLVQAQQFAEEVENELRFSVLSSKECEKCEKRQNYICQGGCIGHKDNEILRYIGKSQLAKFKSKESLFEAQLDYNYKIHKLLSFRDRNIETSDIIKAFPFRALDLYLASNNQDSKLYDSIIDNCEKEICKEPDNPFLYLYIASKLLNTKEKDLIANILNRMPTIDLEANNLKLELINKLEGFKNEYLSCKR